MLQRKGSNQKGDLKQVPDPGQACGVSKMADFTLSDLIMPVIHNTVIYSGKRKADFCRDFSQAGWVHY